MIKRIAILGSTGSIGCNALEVVDHLRGRFDVVALAAHSNVDRLEEQARRYGVERLAMIDPEAADNLASRKAGSRVYAGLDGVCAMIAEGDLDLVVVAFVGSAGLRPTYTAIEVGATVALANKEALVAGGALLTDFARRRNVEILPIDSEHSALFQCLQGEDRARVRRMILTASGGPFRGMDRAALREVSPEAALAHPSWTMGAKVTVDSSTLMNKGLEVIEAHWLFGLSLEKIEVVVHPQSIVHSMVEFEDGSVMAQMGYPDMRLPIQYAMTYPERCPGLVRPFDFSQAHRLDFLPVDRDTFRCLDLAYSALAEGGTAPCYLNAANEVMVERFLGGAMGWLEIGDRLESLMERYRVETEPSLERLLEVDQEARCDARRV